MIANDLIISFSLKILELAENSSNRFTHFHSFEAIEPDALKNLNERMEKEIIFSHKMLFVIRFATYILLAY